MTPKQRWLAALRMKPVDRLPFWPKLDAAYPLARAGVWRGKTAADFHAYIGSDRHTGIAGCLKTVRSRTAEEVIRKDGVLVSRFRTPAATLELVQHFDAASQSWHPVRHPVNTREEIEIMTAFFQDADVELAPDELEKGRAMAAQIGETALTQTGIGQSPLMYWVEWLAGIEQAHYLLSDYPAEVEALFAALHRLNLRRTELCCAHSPADALYLVENTSTTLISPQQFRRYCAPHLGAYAALTREAGRTLILHMCGHLKALLPDLARIPAQAFEAFTSPTLGNTTLLDGRTGCPDTCLIGGTNAMLWTRPAEAIIAQIERDLAVLPHHRGLVVTSAGVMPPRCEPETIRQVADWVRAYPARFSRSFFLKKNYTPTLV